MNLKNSVFSCNKIHTHLLVFNKHLFHVFQPVISRFPAFSMCSVCMFYFTSFFVFCVLESFFNVSSHFGSCFLSFVPWHFLLEKRPINTCTNRRFHSFCRSEVTSPAAALRSTRNAGKAERPDVYGFEFSLVCIFSENGVTECKLAFCFFFTPLE